MGVCCVTNDIKETQKQIEREFHRKNKEQVLMIIGLPQCGKSTIIKQFINLHGCGYKNEYTIKCQYPLQSWIINEYTDQSMIKYASCSYTYLDLLNNYPMKKGYDKRNINEDIKHHHVDHLGESKHFDLLFCGYLRSIQNHNTIIIDLPLDIINCIGLFYAEYQLDSFKIRPKANIKFDLWKMNAVYQKQFHTLFDYIYGLIFICDISTFDEYDSNNNNKFVTALNLFDSLANNETLSEVIMPVVVCNKMDLFKQKFIEKRISLNRCPLFVNCSDHLVLDDAKKLIMNSFTSLTNRAITIKFVTGIHSDDQRALYGIDFQTVNISLTKVGLIP
eukprot:386284_1